MGAYVRRVGITVPSRVLRVEHNGREVPLALWQRLIPRHGDMVVISARGLGGGGGNKVLRTVAMIAVVVVSIIAPYAGPAAWGAVGATGGLTVTGALISAGVMIGGSLLVNALLPPLTPTAAKLGTGEKYESSPTYAISGGRNQSRPWEPMALVMGTHRVVPDLGATPYTIQIGDDQYLHQIFNLGLQGTSLNLSDFRIGSTPISNYQGVQIEISGPDGKLWSVVGNTDSIQGFALSQQDGWVSRVTGDNVFTITVELASRLFRVNDDGSLASRSVDVRIQYRNVNGGDWIDVGQIGATYATHYWSAVVNTDYWSTVQAEYGTTNPDDHYEGQRYRGPTDPITGEARVGRWQWRPHPYQLGQPWVGIAPDPLVSPGMPGIRTSGARQEPTRFSASWSVPLGKYEVRVMKVTADINESRESNETAVSQIISYQDHTADYSGQCRVAVRIKATGQLNGALDELNVLAQDVLPVWNGAAWVVQASSNPAWRFLWFAKGRVVNGVRVFGAGLSDSQIDLEAIKAWGAWCDKKRLTFDFVLDRRMSTAAVLQMIARAGRGAMTYQTGRLGVIWDAEDLPISAMFGPFNVKAGSFKIAYMNDGSVDEVVLNFVNKDIGWVMDEVRARVPGATTTTNPLQLDLDGCTNRDMAGREANLIAAAQVWKRRKITWETDIEGLVCTRGDVVSFSHDLTVWGYSGRLMPGSGGTLMKLQNRVPSNGGGIAMLRDPDGNMKVVTVTSTTGEVDEFTIVTDLDGFPMPGDPGYEDCSPFDWAWQFDPLTTPGRRFKVSGVVPAGDGMRFEAVDDDLGYYAAESNPYQYMPPRDGELLAGVVFSLAGAEQIENFATDQIRFTLSWVLSTDVSCLVSVLVNGIQRVSQVIAGRSTDILVSTGDVLDVAVTPRRSTGSGTPKRETFTVQGLLAPLPGITGLKNVFRDGLTTLAWDPVVDVRQPGYEVRVGTSWANSRVVGLTRNLEILAVGNGQYFVAARFQFGATTIYGPAASVQISGATLVRNVLATVNEDPAWTGSLDGGAFVHDGELTLEGIGDILSAIDVLSLEDVLWYGGVVSGGAYTTNAGNVVDVGYVAPVRVDFSIDEYALNFGEDILNLANVLDEPDLVNESNRQHYFVRPQIQFAGDDGVYGDWQNYVPGTINARYFRVRLVLNTDQPLIVPFVRHFSWTIDLPDLLQTGTAMAVPGSGVRVVYPKPFHALPNLQVTILEAQPGDHAVVEQTVDFLKGFDIQIFNNTTPVERVVNWLAQRY
ncbi:hypothetical protein HGQ98_00765 [Achromobacter ruhlandii]|uniref:Tip attachment protein J domain-containing protein n=2 Tax=Achromobacter ruhlandii TaxID=72557 RepID=A0A848N4Z4_9BURK|nr:hypothetical protein [Achromobacter ruhlandii]